MSYRSRYVTPSFGSLFKFVCPLLALLGASPTVSQLSRALVLGKQWRGSYGSISLLNGENLEVIK
jgi:hypothetical protein